MASPLSKPEHNVTPSLGQTFGSAGRKGEQGERFFEAGLHNFVNVTSELHPPHRYVVTHSLNIPRGRSDNKSFDGDVDFAVASGNRLILIDAKLWKPGFYWTILLPQKSALELLGRLKYSEWAQWLYKNALGRRIGLRGLGPHVDRKWALSQNMELALERYRERLGKHGVEVSAMVVFVLAPGERRFQDVSLLRWPGKIPTFKAAASYAEIYSRLGIPSPVHQEITKLLHSVKRR